MEVAHCIWHGGMYEHVRFFDGDAKEADVDDFVVTEIQRAEEPLP